MSKLKALFLSIVLVGGLTLSISPAYAQQSAQAQITIVVKPAALVFAAQTFNAQMNVPFSAKLAVSGGVAPYACSLVTSPNPFPWLSVNPDCSMSGTPTAPTASAGLGITVQVKDASGAVAVRKIQP